MSCPLCDGVGMVRTLDLESGGWEVCPEHPSSGGTSSHRSPVANTNQITRRATRCPIRGRPPAGPIGDSGGK